MNRDQQSGHGLGTDIVLTINSDKAVDDALFTQLWSQITHFEAQFSRFKADSELNKVNAAAGHDSAVSQSFLDVLHAAIEASNTTDGVYNPLMLGALQHAGYKGSWPAVTTHNADLDYSHRNQITTVDAITLAGSTVQIPSTAALDFGGIGKGYLLDQLADFLDTKHVKHYWLSLGGDIVVKGHDVSDLPWRIGVAAVDDPDVVIDTIINDNGQRMAIATSGITRRKGQNWHHIIDPSTGLPADTDVLSATVTHQSATAADVYAKCMVILGSQQLKNFAKKHAIVRAIIQTNDGRALLYEVNDV